MNEKRKTKQQTSLTIEILEINKKIFILEKVEWLKRFLDRVKQSKLKMTFQNRERIFYQQVAEEYTKTNYIRF